VPSTPKCDRNFLASLAPHSDSALQFFFTLL
jgi:hypothetical protein